MLYCDITNNGKLYRISVTENESVVGIVDMGTSSKQKNGSCTVYMGDGETLCKDLFVRKRIAEIAKKQISRRNMVVG